MDKKIVYIAYLIIFFVLFNFAYGFTDWIRGWEVWNWYLLILTGVMAALLLIKYRQNQRRTVLSERVKETERCRLQLNQLLLFEQLSQLDAPRFNQFLQRMYRLKGYQSIEAPEDRLAAGYDLLMWHEGRKIMLRFFKNVPLTTNLYSESPDLTFEAGSAVSLQEIRETFGAMQDFEHQADELILISTGTFDEAAAAFASRNSLKLMDGHQLYEELEQLRTQPSGSWRDSQVYG